MDVEGKSRGGMGGLDQVGVDACEVDGFDLFREFAEFVPFFDLFDVLAILRGRPKIQGMEVLTPITLPSLTRPGSLRPFDLLPHSIRAFSSVAQSTALKGILLAFSIVSSLDVAVMI